MQYKIDYTLSRIPLTNAELITGMKAQEILHGMGLHLVHVDDDGKIYALDQRNEYISGLFLYAKKTPIITG